MNTQRETRKKISCQYVSNQLTVNCVFYYRKSGRQLSICKWLQGHWIVFFCVLHLGAWVEKVRVEPRLNVDKVMEGIWLLKQTSKDSQPFVIIKKPLKLYLFNFLCFKILLSFSSIPTMFHTNFFLINNSVFIFTSFVVAFWYVINWWVPEKYNRLKFN